MLNFVFHFVMIEPLDTEPTENTREMIQPPHTRKMIQTLHTKYKYINYIIFEKKQHTLNVSPPNLISNIIEKRYSTQ